MSWCTLPAAPTPPRQLPFTALSSTAAAQLFFLLCRIHRKQRGKRPKDGMKSYLCNFDWCTNILEMTHKVNFLYLFLVVNCKYRSRSFRIHSLQLCGGKFSCFDTYSAVTRHRIINIAKAAGLWITKHVPKMTTKQLSGYNLLTRYFISLILKPNDVRKSLCISYLPICWDGLLRWVASAVSSYLWLLGVPNFNHTHLFYYRGIWFKTNELQLV